MKIIIADRDSFICRQFKIPIVTSDKDSLVYFKYTYPRIIHGDETYEYNKQKCSIAYIRLHLW